MSEAADFDAFTQAFHQHFTTNPNRRVFLGVDRDLGELPDPSLEAAKERVTESRELLASLEKVPRDGLGFEQTLDLDLAKLQLEEEIHTATYTFNDRTRLEQLPMAGEEIGDGIFMLMINDPRPDHDRLADVMGRLEAVPDYTRAMAGRLNGPVQRWVKIDAEKVGELGSLLDSVEQWAGRTKFPDAERLAQARRAADDALASYLERLRSLETTTQLHVGDETAREIVRNRGIYRELEEIHGWAREFLAGNAALLEELRVKLADKYGMSEDSTVEQVEDHLAERFAVQVPEGRLEAVLDRYEEERGRILEFIRERELFPVFDEQDMQIVRTPGFMAPSIPAGAMVPPAPFREGTKVSMVYLTLSEELLPEHTRLSIPGMMIHEGIPGHHLQLAHAARHASIIRKHGAFNDLCEGWTTMLEDYMLDVGYMGDLTDEARFVGKRDINRIGARVAIDLFFMTGDKKWLEVGVDCNLSPEDPFEAAGNLLAAVTGFVPGRVQAELNWYSTERAYPLSYLTGNRLVWELKHEAEAAQKAVMEPLELDRRFHRIFLEAGNMPVSFLRRVYEHDGLISPS